MATSFPHLIICGYGWLGAHVARRLNPSFKLTGTTRDDVKASDMRARGIAALRYTLGDDLTGLTQIADGATLLLNIPAGRRADDLDNYQHRMCELVSALADTRLRHLLFISTTSVYGDSRQGDVTEQSRPNPETASARANLAIESHLREALPKRFTILRLAGLTGPDRHPVHMLSGRTLDKGNQVVNLVYSSDVVNAIDVLCHEGPARRILHLCSPLHPKRGEYYPACAAKLHLPAPVFSGTDDAPSGKTVDATATLKYLGLTLKVPDPHDMC